MDPATVLSVFGISAFLCAVVAALALGGVAERIGACICTCGALASITVQSLSTTPNYYALIGIDLAMAVAFTALAMRMPAKLWPGVAAVSQTLLVAFSGTRLIGFPLSQDAYIAAINLSSLGVAVALGAGACAHRWGPASDPNEAHLPAQT